LSTDLVGAADAPWHPAWRAGNLLDLRPSADHLAGHPAGALSLPLPPPPWPDADEPWSREFLELVIPSALLPPRHEPLLLFAARAQHAAFLRDFMRDRGRPLTDACALTAADLASLPAGAVTTGPEAVRLWRPPVFLEEHATLLPPPATGPVLDLGAGSCRASVWLAARGWRVTAIDRHPEALALAPRLAAGLDLGVGRLALLPRDLRDPAAVPPGPWAAALAFRYLDRDICARLPSLLIPGGVAIMRTFRHIEGQERPRSPRHRLEAREWLRLFPESRFEILVHVEDHDPDGRAAAGVVARLRA